MFLAFAPGEYLEFSRGREIKVRLEFDQSERDLRNPGIVWPLGKGGDQTGARRSESKLT